VSRFAFSLLPVRRIQKNLGCTEGAETIEVSG
jgi:hypothetical protein